MWHTLGQVRALAALDAELRGPGPSHAYLFTGPPRVGKGAVARELAMALNCEAAEQFRPCHECRPCERIASARHADVQVLSIDSPCDESNERDHDHARRPATVIRICQVHRACRVAAEAPFEGSRRVFIIEPADLLNNDSANALLKTLEEPPASVVFVLVSSREDAVPETIRSRCRRLEFAPVPAAEIAAHVEAQYRLTPEIAHTVGRLARGRIGWALATVRGDGLAARAHATAEIREVAAGSRARRFAFAADLAKQWGQDRAAVREQLETWGEWWRDLLVVAAGQPALVAHLDQTAALRDEAGKYDARGIAGFLETLRETQGYLEENVNPRLALESMMLSLPAVRRSEAGQQAGPVRG